MASNSKSGFGFTDSGITWGLAVLILAAIGLLAVLRHFFGSIRVSAGAEA